MAGAEQPRALIRADASATIGHGHVMRCLALAQALRERGMACSFAQRRQPGDASAAILAAGFALHSLDSADEADDASACAAILQAQGGVDLLVLDHYQRGAAWVATVRPWARQVLVIDDLADRALAGDWLLDQNWHDDPAARYRSVWPTASRTLFGPAYALLRPEFRQAAQPLRERSRAIARVLLAFGGSDSPNATAACLATLHAALPALQFDVVVGSGSPHGVALQAQWQGTENVTVTVGANDMAQRYRAADLYIGAGGSMTWERACLGLPGITLSIAANQQPLCARIAAAGEGVDLGPFGDEALQALVPALQALLADAPRVQAMGQALALRCDGRGAARVADALLAGLQALR